MNNNDNKINESILFNDGFILDENNELFKNKSDEDEDNKKKDKGVK